MKWDNGLFTYWRFSMKKFFLTFFSALIATSALIGAPKAVVFDWGNVIAFDDRSVVVDFMCGSLQISETEFEAANLDKRKAVKAGKSDIDFWCDFAKQKGVQLPNDWAQKYTAALKASVGADPDMYLLIDQLKKNEIRVGLLSNINDRYTTLIRDFGFYEPFEPCLLSCEIGLEKPNPKVYELLLERMHLSPQEIVFIDDKAENVEAAKEMGIDAILFESEPKLKGELIKRGILEHEST